MNIIDRQDLRNNAYYLGESNETYLAKWNADTNVFEYIFNSTIKTVPYRDNFTSIEDMFIPLLEIKNLRIDILRSGILEKI